MAKKEKVKEVKTTDITKIVKTEKPKEEVIPKEKIESKTEPLPKEEKPKPKERIPHKTKKVAERKPRKDKGQRHEKIILGTTTAPQSEKKGWSTSMKVGFTLGTLTVFAVAFYAMYKALERYREEKKKLAQEEFIEEETEEEFIEDEPDKNTV